jgi:hypothetical protein
MWEELNMGAVANIVLLIVWILTIVAGFGLYYSHYSDVTYQADQGKEWLWRARATNDLEDMAKYLKIAEEKLEPYHGNPVWWYPKPDSDYDFIKTNIQEVIENAESFNTTAQNDFSYQQAVQNLQETIIEIVDHVEIANGWLQWPPISAFIYTLWIWLWLPFLLIALIFDD